MGEVKNTVRSVGDPERY